MVNYLKMNNYIMKGNLIMVKWMVKENLYLMMVVFMKEN